jgi:membrane-associated phospholipid phosphatase
MSTINEQPSQRDNGNEFSAVAIPRPETAGEHIAHWVSHLGSPPAAGIAASSITVARLTVPGLWQWVSVYVLLALVTPLSFLIWQVHQGHVSDLDVYFRKQRKGSLLVTIAGLALTWLLMNLGVAPPILRFMVGAGLLMWVAIYLVTLRWKISIHAASISEMSFFLIWGFGLSAAPALLAIPAVGWSRVKLRRHTPAQVIAGAGLGCLAVAVAVLCSPSLRTPGFLTR